MKLRGFREKRDYTLKPKKISLKSTDLEAEERSNKFLWFDFGIEEFRED